ncbi:MAG: DUF3047 domain-containing protein [Akkermansiaceae bacterium]|nr:DUF3047 domain-containing protein [Verrucomicrobiales bacterium]
MNYREGLTGFVTGFVTGLLLFPLTTDGYGEPMLLKAIAGVLIFAAAVSLAAETNILFREDFEKPLGDRWQPIKFEGLTDYQVKTDGSNSCLVGIAKGTASALATRLDLQPVAAMVIAWRWKIDRCPANGTDEPRMFDHSARVFVSFDTFIGPPKTINYAWANQVKTNSTFDHPSSSRARFIALRSGDVQAGGWVEEQRDLVADWKRLFPGEKMPRITGLGVFTDSDETKVSVTGAYDDIVLGRR